MIKSGEKACKVKKLWQINY